MTPVRQMPGLIDEARRQFGRLLELSGLGPQETPSRTVAEFAGARLRAYQEPERRHGPVMLIVAAPFKRAYIWDLMPQVSVVRQGVRRGFRVYLLEWLIPGEREDGFGLGEYADRLPTAALETIAAETGSRTALLCGHSIGGTFAAIVATLAPERVSGLILVDAPLAFGKDGGPLAEAVATMPHGREIRASTGTPVAGALVNALSAGAVPEAFHLQRMADLAASLLDPKALAIHARVERWAYDEFPLPGQLFEDVLELLYREDRFRHGTLRVGRRQTGLDRLKAPVMAVVNPVGRIVPPASVLRGLAASPIAPPEVLTYPGDRGPMLQHLGPLVAPLAHELLWPRILDWANGVGRRGLAT